MMPFRSVPFTAAFCCSCSGDCPLSFSSRSCASCVFDILPALGPGYSKIPQLEFAKGGTAIATSPTLVKVGEAGPELFTAIPLAKGGSVLGGIRNRMSGDFNLTIDGNQSNAWSADFEGQVAGVVASIFREAFEE